MNRRGSVPGRLAALSFLAWVAAAGLMAETPSPQTAFSRLKWTQETIGELIRAGYDRSPSFRSLVSRLELSNAIVLVRLGYCKGGRFRACLTSISGSTRERHLRIRVDPQTTRNRLIAAIGHELRHAVEVIEQPEVHDAKSAMALFRRIGNAACGTAAASGCETDAALETEARILAELHEKAPSPVLAVARR